MRHFGVGETMMNMATKGIHANKDKQFGEMLETMVATPKWSFRPWRATMETQLQSWTMYIPGVGTSAEAQELKNFKSMLDAMTDVELDNPEKINGPARERIARAAGRSVDDVVRLVYFFKQSLIICTWLQLKKQKGEEMPKTELELQKMQETDTRMRSIAAKMCVPTPSTHLIPFYPMTSSPPSPPSSFPPFENSMQPRGKTGRGRRLPF